MCIKSRSIGKGKNVGKQKGMEDKRAEINKLVEHRIPSGDGTLTAIRHGLSSDEPD